jgi:hypothetical protein
MSELRSISTRAVITSTSFTNHYEWGDLKADPLKLLEKYFDVFVYIANWGTRILCFRLPQELVDYKQLKSMLPGNSVQVRKSGNFVIITFECEVEDSEWDDGTQWMGSLMPLRQDLLRDDFRSLYLGWLLCVQNGEFSQNTPEPAVPDGLNELSAPLHSLLEFIDLYEDLIKVSAQASAPLNAGPSREELTLWIQNLSEKEKNSFLFDAITETGERWKIELLRCFHRPNSTAASASPVMRQRRTVKDLLSAAHALEEERNRLIEEEIAQQKAEEAANRARYLDQLEKCEGEVWSHIAAHIQKLQPLEYDKAVILLTDLRDLSIQRGTLASFQSSLEKLRRTHSAKTSFLRRLTKVGL